MAANLRPIPSPATLAPSKSARRALAHAHTVDVAAAIDAFEAACGGRTALIAALATLDPSDDLTFIVGALADPSADCRHLSAVCKDAGITLGELIQSFKKGALAVPMVEAIQTIARRLPAVVREIMINATPHPATCPDCGGATTTTQYTRLPDREDLVEDVIPCARCLATGTIEIRPTVDQQKLALSLTPLAGKANGAVVQIDNRSVTVNGDASPTGLAKLLTMTDRVLHQRRGAAGASGDVIEAEMPEAGEAFDVD